MKKLAKTVMWDSYELYQFTDGIRWATLTWSKEMPFGERRCVAVKDSGFAPVSR